MKLDRFKDQKGPISFLVHTQHLCQMEGSNSVELSAQGDESFLRLYPHDLSPFRGPTSYYHCNGVSISTHKFRELQVFRQEHSILVPQIHDFL